MNFDNNKEKGNKNSKETLKSKTLYDTINLRLLQKEKKGYV